ncbi:MAG: exonuclease, polymerase epsilon subunit family [Acidimicrobiales bacterium]|nr:exonuclease, polymerase epsilon subunit family [Acidimicrobiales bacterium]
MQRSFDDLGTPLHDVTFCVLDLETTGGSAADGGITEIGAVKVQGGQRLGTFRTFVNPGCSIPRQITVLTGITQAMVEPAPTVDAVLPTLLEFVGDAVVVGHNVRYDLGYLNAALERSGRACLDNLAVDTLALARRLLRDEVPNCRLGTLADRLRLPNRPSHRALEDSLATADLLHVLLERAAGFGVLGLDDLIALPKMAGHAQAAKLKLTDNLPRRPGVYLFRDGAGRTLYVGKATNLRSRVRSYFSTDDRRKIGALLRETQRIDHVVCASPLEAAVIEVRLIHRLDPRFNRQATTWRRSTYLKLTAERFPRLSVVRAVRPDGALYLGPLPSAQAARRVAEAIETAVPLRRCTGRPGGATRSGPCAPAQIGVATCPCAGQIGEAAYADIVATVVRGITVEPSLLLAPLDARMRALAAAERFEEAADMRDRAAALTHALRRQRRFESLRRAGRIVVEVPGRSGAELRHGRLVRSWSLGARGPVDVPLPLDLDPAAPEAADQGPVASAAGHPQPLPRELADELMCVASWLDREAAKIRLVHCDAGLSSPFPALPSFAARR